MPLRTSLARGALVACALVLLPACSKDEPVGEGTKVRFSKVPLVVDVPPGWSQSLNTATWIMYRPDSGGALVAMSGEKSCSTVEKRVYGALLEVGLTEVTWRGAPRQTRLGGLDATVAEGHALEGGEQSKVEYAIVQAPERRGCLLALVAVWESRAQEHGKAADAILRSVHADD